MQSLRFFVAVILDPRAARIEAYAFALTRALRARRARPPEVAEEVAEKVAYLAALQPRAQRA